jgi:DNA-binding response OmpR family regulator
MAPRTQTAVDWPIQVLLVEDNIEAAWLVQNWLEWTAAERFRVEWTRTVEEAMQRLKQPGIEVILLDLGLPELKGYRSFEAIKAVAENHIPVVILTADDSALSRDLTVGFGASDYLLKGAVSPAKLRQSLFDAIREGRPQLH